VAAPAYCHFVGIPFDECGAEPRRSIISMEVVEMQQGDLMAISRKLDDLIRRSDDPREALRDLVRVHGPERTAEEARIVFGSWRSRIDLVAETLKEVLAEQGRASGQAP
jgi:hypothetical protein